MRTVVEVAREALEAGTPLLPASGKKLCSALKPPQGLHRQALWS